MYVTVAIPFYNPGEFFIYAINSVLNQSYQYFELLLVDDGSTDGSLAVARSIQDDRVRVISDGKNRRLAARLNQVTREAKYDLIARMDADDVLDPFRLEKQVDLLTKNPQADIVSTGLVSFSGNGDIAGYRFTPEDKAVNFFDVLNSTSGVMHATILARKQWHQRNPYDEQNKISQDYVLWLNAYLNNDLNVVFCRETLYYYREDQNLKFKKLFLSRRQVLRKQLDMFKDGRIKLGTFLVIFLLSLAKLLVVCAYFFFNIEKKLLKRRNMAFTDSELEAEKKKLLLLLS